MEIGKSLNVLRAKWWIIVLIAVIGAFIGTYLALSQNRSIQTRWFGEASVTFIEFTSADGADGSGSKGKGANSTSAEINAQAEGTRAQLLLEETLKENPNLAIVVDRTNNVLTFTAVGRDGDATLAQALELRSQYQSLSSDVLNIDQIEESIASLLVEIESLQTEIDALTVGDPPAEDPEITSTRTVLVTEISTLNERQTQLRIWVFNPELRPTEDEFFGIVTEPDTTETDTPVEPVLISTEELNKESDENARALSRLDVQLSLVPDEPQAEELDTVATLALEALQAQQAALQAQYVDLLQIADGRSTGGFSEEPIATDITAATSPVSLFALVGFVVGAMIASIVLVGLDRARKTVWAGDALENVTSLGQIDRNRSDGLPQDIWYPTSVSRRRRDIQAFRATIDAITQEKPAIVGFFGVRTAGDEVGELAADLATSYTVAGRDVLLIDANAYQPNTLVEFGEQSSSLTRILVRNLPVTEAISAINDLIDATPQVIPHLTSLHVDAATHDPIDAIASPNSRSLMDIARERFDVVIVAGPAISDPLSDTVARRIDFAVLAGTAGKTTMPQIATATGILTERHTVAPGVVILKGKRRALIPSISERFHSTRSSVETTVERWRASYEGEHEQGMDVRPPEQSTTDASGVEDLVEQTTNTGSKAGPSTN